MKQVLNSLMGLREGNSLPLRVATVELRWSTERMAVDNGNCSGLVEFLVKYSAQEISQRRNELKQVDEVLQELTEIREIIGIDSAAWIPDDEHLEQSMLWRR